MSFIYSQALVEEFLQDNCSDIDASALSSGSPTPRLCLSHDRTMDVSRLSRFGMTCKPLTESHGADVLTWWLEGFPVRTSALQERAQESTEPAAECGAIWRGWLAKFDPASSSWKTAQHSLIEDLEESLATFPRSGMTRGGLLWELPTLERPTSETGSGSWPTPTANQFDCTDVPKLLARRERVKAERKNGNGFGLTLAQAVRVQMWPTPTRHNAKETNAPSEAERNTPTLAAQVGGALNPNWTEWLMGWPIGHTALQPSGMVKSPNALRQHGESLEAAE